ncbi:MAG TPA: hypothetical protein VK846_09405 [Candidatus Limnocylindria bacterium]|nr:hypothetical protein [Candidatus Limnocylindria bacterium]
MSSRVRLSFILFFVAHWQAFSAAESFKEVRSELEKQIIDKEFVLRSAPNVAGIWYLTIGSNEYLLKQKNSGLFPKPVDVPNVKITKVRHRIEKEVVSRIFRPDRGKLDQYDERTVEHQLWVFSSSHRYLGKGELQIERLDNQIMSTLESIDVLAYAFKGQPFKDPVRYRASSSSVLHFAGCGHDDATNNFRDFATIDEGLRAGMQLCSLCFNKRLSLPSYGQESIIGKETEANLRHYYRLVSDSNLPVH